MDVSAGCGKERVNGGMFPDTEINPVYRPDSVSGVNCGHENCRTPFFRGKGSEEDGELR